VRSSLRRAAGRLDLKLVLALPGLLLGGVGLVMCLVLGLPLGGVEVEVLVPACLAAYFGIAALAAAFERLSLSFRDAGGLLEDIVRRLGLTPLWALALGLTSAVGEELFFRGFALSLLGRFVPPVIAVLVQAAMFAAMHPAPRTAWAYPAWAFVSGSLLGAVALGTGSILPGLLAHYLFNHQNFNAVLESQRRE